MISMIQEVKRKFLDLGKRQPIYLGDYEYLLIKEFYHRIYRDMSKSFVDVHLKDEVIYSIVENCDNSFLHIRRLCDDRIAILILSDLSETIEELIEDCANEELYESAHNLKRIYDYINEGDV